MRDPLPFVDIHCHLLPGVDDGAADWDESLAMARMAVDDGISTVIVTPHQLGHFAQNHGAALRAHTAQLQQFLDQHEVPLRVLPGADVRIEPEMVRWLIQGDVLSLGDLRRHVLLELPHDVFVPLDRLLTELRGAGMVGILSHPERNLAILDNLDLVEQVVAAGGLVQVTAGSFTGSFGPQSRSAAEQLLARDLIHFVSTDAHGVRARRPRLRPAFERVAQLAGWDTAVALCCRNPALVAEGKHLPERRHAAATRGTSGRKRAADPCRRVAASAPAARGLWPRWFARRRAG